MKSWYKLNLLLQKFQEIWYLIQMHFTFVVGEVSKNLNFIQIWRNYFSFTADTEF